MDLQSLTGEADFIAKLRKLNNNQWLILTILGLAIVLIMVSLDGRPIASYPYIEATWGWIFDAEGEYAIADDTRAVIVPHDYLSYNEINSFYRGLAESVNPKTIIVLA